MNQKQLTLLIEKETLLIKDLEGQKVEPEYYTYNNGKTSGYPKGNYAIHITKIKDAYWRRRNWEEKLDKVKNQCSE